MMSGNHRKKHVPGEPGWDDRSPINRAKLLWPEAAKNREVGGDGDHAVVSRCKVNCGDGPERYDTVSLWGDERKARAVLEQIDRLGCGGHPCEPNRTHFLVNVLTGVWATGVEPVYT